MNTKLIAGAVAGILTFAVGGTIMLTGDSDTPVDSGGAVAVAGDRPVTVDEYGVVRFQQVALAEDADSSAGGSSDGESPADHATEEPVVPPGAPEPGYIELGHGASIFDDAAVTAPEGAAASLADAGETVQVVWQFSGPAADGEQDDGQTEMVDGLPIGGILVFDPAAGEVAGSDIVRYNATTFETTSSEWVGARGAVWARTVPISDPEPWRFGSLESALLLDSQDRDANAILNLLLNGGSADGVTVTTDGGDRPTTVTIAAADGFEITGQFTYGVDLPMPDDRPMASMSDDEIEAYIAERYGEDALGQLHPDDRPPIPTPEEAAEIAQEQVNAEAEAEAPAEAESD